MDGIHDLGGKHGFGKVEREIDEPAFHARWEASVFAISAVGPAAGAWNNSDRFRHGVERIDPVSYLADGYYGRWLGGMETLLVEAGAVTTEEITARALEMGAPPGARVAARPSSSPDPQGPAPPAPGAKRVASAPAAFAVGDAVVTSTLVKSGHTRLPAYARGKRGVIHASHNAWVFPDTNAHGLGEQPQYLYTVKFSGPELWGSGSDPSLAVYLDLFEPYLASV
ncbi:MAG: nitrile hydratase subunit beta [Pseudomonadota bacterium]